jgi:YtcA family
LLETAVSPDAVAAPIKFADRRSLPAVGLLPALLLLSGCADAGAPSFALFGAFFPAWMFCAAIGIVGAGLARAVFVGTGLAAVLPYQLLVCTAVGTIAAIAAWLLAFGG